MDCGIGNTNLLGSSYSGLGYDYYDCFYMKSTDGATMYFNLATLQFGEWHWKREISN